jgi:phage protein D
MKPTFQITAKNAGEAEKDVTAMLRTCLVSLELANNAGKAADSLTLVLADKTNSLVIPPLKTLLGARLGYDDGQPLVDMGEFELTGVKWSTPPAQLTLTCSTKTTETEGKANPATAMQAAREAEWPKGTSIEALLARIAGTYGAQWRVSTSLRGAVTPQHELQRGESDNAFLSRIAGPFFGAEFALLPSGVLSMVYPPDALKAAGGTGASGTGAGAAVFTLRPGGFTSLSWEQKTARKFNSVKAEWADIAGAQIEPVFAGAGEPTDVLKMPFPSKDAALKAARARLGEVQRGSMALTVTLPPPRALLLTGDVVLRIAGVAPVIDGDWAAAKVSYRLSSSGLSATIQCDCADDKKTGPAQ